jgi:putative hemolysin
VTRHAASCAAFLALASCSGGGEVGNAAEENIGSSARDDIARDLARVEIRPGLWEVNSEILAASQPRLPHEMAEGIKGRRPVRRHCITPERAARPDGGFLNSAGSRCTHRGFAMRGGRLEGTTICAHPEGETRATLTGRYTPERFDFESEIQTPGYGEVMTIRGRHVGRRIGECRQGAAAK